MAEVTRHCYAWTLGSSVLGYPLFCVRIVTEQSGIATPPFASSRGIPRDALVNNLLWLREVRKTGSTLHRALLQLALQRTAMHFQLPRRCGNIAVIFLQHFLDMLPFQASHGHGFLHGGVVQMGGLF